MASTLKQPDHIRESHHRVRLTVVEAGRVDDCKRICAHWHNRFGGCLVLDAERLRILIRRLVVEDFTVADMETAIDAYHHHCTTDTWRREHPAARLDFNRFVAGPQFEQWLGVARLTESRKQTVAQRTETDTAQLARRQAVLDAEARQRKQLAAWFDAKPADEQAAILELAVRNHASKHRGYRVTHRSPGNRLLQPELQAIMSADVGASATDH